MPGNTGRSCPQDLLGAGETDLSGEGLRGGGHALKKEALTEAIENATIWPHLLFQPLLLLSPGLEKEEQNEAEEEMERRREEPGLANTFWCNISGLQLLEARITPGTPSWSPEWTL